MKKVLLFFLAASVFFAFAAFAQDIGLKKGTKAPDFEAKNYLGETVRLSEYVEDGPTVLVFYRGSWCHFCNLQLQDYAKHIEEFDRFGATVVAISVDKQEVALDTVQQKQYPFDIISDPAAELLELYKVVYIIPEETQKLYKEKYKIDLSAASGRQDGVVAVPATYIIDPEGRIIYAYANEDYKVRPEIEDILEVLSSLP